MAAVSLPGPMPHSGSTSVYSSNGMYDNAMLRRARTSLMTWLCFYSYTMPTQMTYQGITLVRASISTSDVTSTCLYSSHISSIEHCLNSTSRRIMSIYPRGCSVLLGCIPGCLQIVPMELTIVPGGLPPPQTPLTDRPPGRPTGRDMQHEGTMPLRIMRGCDMTFATGDVVAPQIEGPSWCICADHGIPVSAPRQALHRSGRLAGARGVGRGVRLIGPVMRDQQGGPAASPNTSGSRAW